MTITVHHPDAPLIRRATIGLFLTQSIASAALLASTTVNPIVISRLSGQDALAGLPTALMLAGASLAAYPAGRMMGQIGRRYGLLVGCVLAVAGGTICAISVATGMFVLFLLGLAVLGAGRATLDQARYAAAEINPPERRGRALSRVIFGGTIGAILGPAVVAPASSLAASFHIEPLAGPFIATALMVVLAGLVIFLLLSMDLRGIAARVALAVPTAIRPSRAMDETVRKEEVESKRSAYRNLLSLSDARVAMFTMISAQAAMVMMMAIISLHMTHHNHDLGEVSLVTSGHVLGMYAFSPLIGHFADRVGRRLMVLLSACTMAAGCIIAPLSLMTPWIGLALFLIGLGWSGCYIAGSTLLTDAFASKERPRMQGANEVMVNISSAVGSLSSGVLLQAFGFNIVSMIGLAVSVVPLVVMLFSRPARLGGRPRIVEA
ncbi:MAG TPA: MFS transporter [Anaerolineae bacterium]